MTNRASHTVTQFYKRPSAKFYPPVGRWLFNVRMVCREKIASFLERMSTQLT
jgi:hypothetical protein